MQCCSFTKFFFFCSGEMLLLSMRLRFFYNFSSYIQSIFCNTKTSSTITINITLFWKNKLELLVDSYIIFILKNKRYIILNVSFDRIWIWDVRKKY